MPINSDFTNGYFEHFSEKKDFNVKYPALNMDVWEDYLTSPSGK
jgi:hypothetical protein